jgi:hypothetical protein
MLQTAFLTLIVPEALPSTSQIAWRLRLLGKGARKYQLSTVIITTVIYFTALSSGRTIDK